MSNAAIDTAQAGFTARHSAKSAIVSYMESAAPAERSISENGDRDLAPLLREIGEKDRQAFEQFYDATCPRVFGLALRITQRRELAEEVVCDVFVHVWENSAQYDASRGSVIAWLMTICRSRSIDALRREKARSGDKDRDDALRVDQIDHEDDPLDLLEAIDRKSTVYSALKRLNDEQRQLIALAFFRGYSYAEIADFTAKPLGTVKSQIRRALIALRSDLAGGDIKLSQR